MAARKHFLGAENVGADGSLIRGRAIFSWFSVGSFAASLDGRLVLFDSYIHKGEDAPNYVPTTTQELIDLRPEAIFLGHGHFDHAKNAGIVAAKTGAVLVGTPEHCDQAKAEAEAEIRCVEAVSRGSDPGRELNEINPLGPGIHITALKHVHSATEAPDGEKHASALDRPVAVDPGNVLLHPPGPSAVPGLNPSGDEGGTLLYRFELGQFSFIYHDSAGPLRERAPHLFDILKALPPTDVEIGAVLGFNEPTNGVRDPVDYITALKPKLFVPNHHDFVSEYGSGRNFEDAIKRELATRDPVPTQLRWMNDPYDYLRPGLMTYDLGSPLWADGAVAPATARRACLPRRARTSGGRSIGQLTTGATRAQLARRIATRPLRTTDRATAWCVRGASGALITVFANAKPAARSVLVATTSPAHRTRAVGPGTEVAELRRRFPRARALTRGAVQAFPGSARIFAVRKGRVAAITVAAQSLIRNESALRRALAEALRA